MLNSMYYVYGVSLPKYIQLLVHDLTSRPLTKISKMPLTKISKMCLAEMAEMAEIGTRKTANGHQEDGEL